jgi:type IV pilus assembly protein PilP
MTRKTWLLFCLGLGALVLVAQACGDSGKAPAPAAPVPKAPAAPVVTAVPDGGAAIATASADVPYEYVYTPIGKRDPFRSPLLDMVGGPSQQGPNNCQSPLCRYDLDQFKLVGIVSGMSNPVAMVEDPKGKGWLLQRGTQIGRNSGKVTAIRPQSVVVTEIVRTTGKPIQNPIEMKMPVTKDTTGDEPDQDFMSLGGVQ